jgi:hypothetical protein
MRQQSWRDDLISFDFAFAWSKPRPSWIRIPLYAAAATGAWSLFINLAGLINTLQAPRTTLAGAFAASAWLALHGALGGLAYALLSSRWGDRGRGARLSIGALTMVAALIPTLVLAFRTMGVALFTSSAFWVLLLSVIILGAIAVGRPWHPRHHSGSATRPTRQTPLPSARDYGLAVGMPEPPPRDRDQPHN